MENFDKIEDAIWNGIDYKEGISNPTHLDLIRNNFLINISKMENSEIEDFIDKCTSELERIKFVLQYFEWTPVPEKYFLTFKKDANLSKRFRERANNCFRQQASLGNKNITAATLRGYNLALSFAPNGEEEEALAYSNRSALFLHVKKYNLAKRDLRLAIKNKNLKNDGLLAKLKEREKKCDSYLKEEESKSKNNRKATENEQLNIFTLKTPNAKIVNAEEFVSIDYNELSGRKLVVNKNIPPGTVILVEKPFISVLERVLTFEDEYCHFCLKRIFGGLPCPNCSFAFFCSESCLKKANSTFHNYEHLLIPYLHYHFGRVEFLAIRILTTMGPTKLYQIFKENPKMEGRANIKGFNQNNIYDGGYFPIYHLISHKFKPFTLFSNTFKAVLLAHILKAHTQFFENIPEKDLNSFFEYVASLILRHLENISFNLISFNELRNSSEEDYFLEQVKDGPMRSIFYATGLFGLLSLVNHSCSPNSIHIKCQSKYAEYGNSSLITLKHLKAGEELFISYGPIFIKQNLSERRKELLEKYFFECQCKACQNNWSLSTNLTEEDYKQLTLPENIKTKKKDFFDIFKDFEYRVAKANQLLINNQPVDAINLLKDCLHYFSTNDKIYFINEVSRTAQEILKRSLISIVYEIAE